MFTVCFAFVQLEYTYSTPDSQDHCALSDSLLEGPRFQVCWNDVTMAKQFNLSNIMETYVIEIQDIKHAP